MRIGVSFVLSSSHGYLVWIFSAMYDILFSMLANHQIRHQASRKVGCHLVVADGQITFLGSLCEYIRVNILT